VDTETVSPQADGHPVANIADSAPRRETDRHNRPKRGLLPRLGRKIRHPVNRWLTRQSLIGDEAVLDPKLLPELEVLGRNWRTVAREIQPLLDEREAIPAFGDVSPDHRRIAPTAQWKSYFLEGYGYRPAHNRARCPETAAMLDSIPGLVVAFFSIMEPGTHVPRHRGLTKAWLNCHLGISVPEDGRCEMAVNDELVRWREGEWLVFDETNPNPAKSNLNILISQFEDSHLTFSLIGVSGKKVLEYDAAHLNNEKIIMNISGLAPGLYLLHIKDHQGSHLQTQKILIIN
jgi:beta-hydroxylase